MIKKKKSLPLIPVLTVAIVLTLALAAYFTWVNQVQKQKESVATKINTTVQIAELISLPKPVVSGRVSLETAIFNRRSRRDFVDVPVSLKQIGQILWAAQGVTADWGGRTAPSAKSAYPLTLYLAAYRVDGLNAGIYKYIPGDLKAVHQIALIESGNLKIEIGDAIGQNAAKGSPALLIITGDMDKMAKAFDNKRIDSNVYLEAGHAAQNMYLEAESLGLGMVTMAGFDGNKVRSVVGIPDNETVIYAIPLGVPKK